MNEGSYAVLPDVTQAKALYQVPRVKHGAGSAATKPVLRILCFSECVMRR